MAPLRDKKLVIVESPAKAKTIGQFLDGSYVVEASFGHVRDLPNNAGEIPASVKKESWARLGVNVDDNFAPLYIVPSDKRKHVARLKTVLKDASRILLATDEDREGESISWHLLTVLKPAKSIDVRRIVFHEITREAILHALENPREMDDSLVKAQESRRILDRLYGYTLSPLLWKKVAPGLSAGRVQSVATRLIVERERLRKNFLCSEFWKLAAELDTGSGRFKAHLIRLDGAKVATGKSFDSSTGVLKEKRHVLLDEASATRLKERLEQTRPWVVSRVEQSPGQERPVPPFTTSTLQQDANRKLRFSARRTMRIAQTLYEGIDLDGERVGLITYMRTDSVTLANRAVHETREVIKKRYGPEYVPDAPRRYRTTTKNAQEAHEAIRPTNLGRHPDEVRRYLDNDQFRLYQMIWKRTIACQMVNARVLSTTVDVTVDDALFSVRGKQILFPGFLRVYVEGRDDVSANDKESLLPNLEKGQTLEPTDLIAQGQSTRPPARYTEASLVKKLEEKGIGRPSTYATIISTIQDRGYIFKRAQELVPTFVAFGVTEFLETHFHDLVDVGFTSVMEDQLDEIARGRRDPTAYLRAFYSGSDGQVGLVQRVEQEANRLEFPRIRVGETPDGVPIVVKVGRFGPYIQRGEGGQGHFAPIPDELPPADLDVAAALELLERRAAEPQIVGTEPGSGREITLQKGRFGDYLEVSITDEEKEAKIKPRRVSLPKALSADEVTEEIARKLVSLPRELGVREKDGETVVASIGRFGPYVKAGSDSRSLKTWEEACDIDLEKALEVLNKPKSYRRGAAARTVLKELGELEGAAGPVKVLDGRYGPYITDGTTNAKIPEGASPETLTAEQAVEALKAKASAGGGKRGRRPRRAASGAKKAAASKTKRASTKTKKKAASKTKSASSKS